MTIVGHQSSSSQPSAMNGGGGNFQSLASSALPSLGGEPLTRPTWKRSLQELAASNLQSNSGRTSIAPTQPTAAAQLLLGSQTDFGNLRKSNLKKKPSTSSLQNKPRFSFDAGGIENVVRRHRDGILERILKDQRKETNRLLEKAVEDQVEADWKEERAWWRQELVGDRNLVNATNPQLLTGGGGAMSTDATAARGMLVPSHNAASGDESNVSAVDPKTIQAHLEIVREITDPSRADPLQVIASFEQLASKDETSSNPGYHTAWKILGSVLPRLMRHSSPVGAAQGAQSHLCKQYASIITSHVRSAELQGQDVRPNVDYGNNAASLIASYVKLVSGSHASVWEILYYCLRCGDANAANAVIMKTPPGRDGISEQPIVGQVIGHLAGRQGSASCMFDVGSPNIMSRDQSTLLNLYESTKNLDPGNSHKLSVLALLCGQRLDSFNTVEDYLFGCLWLALMDRENPTGQIEVIGASVRKYGPSHFSEPGTGAWGYVLPLLVAQQFETALSYLSEAGGPTGLLQATHLGLAFALAGVPVADLGGTATSSSRGGSASKDVITALLVNYTTMVCEREPSAGVPASLEYLLKIPSNDESNYQIASLIYRASPDHIDLMTGVLDEVGTRKNSVLDERLSNENVSSILVKAAELFRKQTADRSKVEKSAKLYMLGYKHTNLVELLNEQIVPIHVSDQNREFWMTQSQLFFESHLSKRTSVLESIEREGKLKLIETNRCLLEFRSFYQSFRQRRFDEAMSKVGATQLLPGSTEELDEKVSRFTDLDPILQSQFPAVLTATVECLSELFFATKNGSSGYASPTVQDRLKELNFGARIIFIFAGRINMPSSCKNDIARMRANMIC